MYDITLNDLALSQESGFRVLSDTKWLTWEAPDYTLMARGGRRALATGTRWPTKMPSVVLKVGVFADTDDQLASRLGALYRVVYMPSVRVEDTPRGRFLLTVLGSSVSVEQFPSSHYAEATFTLESLTHGWLADTDTVLAGETESGDAFNISAPCGDVPVQDVDILLALTSNVRASITSASTASQVSLDLSNAPEIPSGSTYWYRLSTTTYQGGRVATDDWAASWSAADDVSQYLSLSYPGFVLTPDFETSEDTLRVVGADAVKLRYRRMWVA